MPAIDLSALADIVKDTPDGYQLFYTMLWNRSLPAHCREWIEKIYAAGDKPAFVEAFRGSTKTTVITITLAAFKTGLYPNKTGLIVNAADEKAEEFASAIAEIIKSNVAWKAFFPNVVPDYERGWSKIGYNVKRDDVDYGEWTRQLSADPSFVGYGYTSSGITGKHPSGWLVIDDIHNEENTSSAREMARVKKIYSGTIMFTRNPHYPLTLVVGTPWRDDDTYADIKGTNSYVHIRTPARRADGTPTWPEGMGEDRIKQAEAEDLTGGVETARMLFLDLAAMKKRVFQYQSYPAHLIEFGWPMQGGVDYASVADPTKRTDKQSHFALAYVAKSPEGMAVVYDGVLVQCSMGEGMDYIEKAQSMFPHWLHCEIEGDGKGEEFFQHGMLKPSLRVVMSKTGGRSKAHRLVDLLGPWLRLGKVRLSDASTPFLNAARNFMNKYPNVGEHDPGWDAMDAIYRALVAMPDVLVMEKRSEDIQRAAYKVKTANPWASLGQKQHA